MRNIADRVDLRPLTFSHFRAYQERHPRPLSIYHLSRVDLNHTHPGRHQRGSKVYLFFILINLIAAAAAATAAWFGDEAGFSFPPN